MQEQKLKKSRFKNPKVVAFDFDETIGLFKKGQKHTGYTPKVVDNYLNPKMVSLIKNLRKNKIKVIIYSSRHWGDYNVLIEWLNKNKLKVDDVILGRFKADVYVCDRSTNPHSNNFEKEFLSLLREEKSWGDYYEEYYSNRKPKKYKNLL